MAGIEITKLMELKVGNERPTQNIRNVRKYLNIY